ncbi:MAG: sodium:solute symporter family protein [Actinomycetota bacterium]|nr:sodium:solute symporter family protein [Actinomycetota bacterium]
MSRKVGGNSTNYLVAGRCLPSPLIAAALMGAAVDSNATLGNTDLAAELGFWAGASLPLGLALCLVLTGLFLAKPMNRMGLLTLPDFYRRTYGRGVEVTASLLMIFAFCILLAGNLVAGGFIFERFLGTSYPIGVLLIVALVLTATAAGGMFSNCYTAIIKVAVIGVAAVALLAWVAVAHGITIPDGMGPFDLEQLTRAESGAVINWATLVSLGIGDIVAIDFMQRIFSARSPESARRACFLGAGGTVLVGVPFALVAISIPAILGDAPADGPVLLALLGDVAPVGLAILVLSGIVAASFVTASGAVLATSAVAARNILQIRQERALDARDPLLRATRLAFLPVAVLGVFFALRVPQTGILLTLAFDLMLAALVVPFLLGLFWRRSSTAAAVAAITVGLTVRLTLFALTPTIFGAENTLLYVPNDQVGTGFDGWPTFIAVTASLAAFVIAALTGPRWRTETASISPHVQVEVVPSTKRVR